MEKHLCTEKDSSIHYVVFTAIISTFFLMQDKKQTHQFNQLKLMQSLRGICNHQTTDL